MTVDNFTELYHRIVEERPTLAQLLPGHLAIEFLLGKIILQVDSSLSRFVAKATHAQLITKCKELGAIDAKQAACLTSINRMRNKFAHELTFEPTIPELQVIWAAAAEAFSDMTDGIEQGIGDLAEKGSVEALETWVFPELFVQICYDLQEIHSAHGGEFPEF